ncbi:expressed protein [Batrachochytrium dendrobatidis JAM81]|uniref:Expressed protein n=1 Tax=Batrachochytrium dendrobatidis (strain JAM81 / FGSC 10211) TaxID=684364 RepID=F4PAW6_BATDJ|nr:uncharacterized protein BATDEDRAFT_35945 [Batrachochytrium dendrobatidis JAM81]EGF77754.1 expressed protein [Batrachochytrium dendrobatidis JAM81]KAJ8323815.1 hypothetical protein O5D80_007699 [Batrachochytrium dendrobatidis]KAK5666268.1 hypothetical protein QVD99_007030 [Batrachochytrium dendrobatidis]|eukprot:XP_006681724.1 expressed protein [Batrachochytrium dendrobatidis JAM81]
MVVIVQDMPSGGLLFRGELTQRKMTVKSHRQVMLCLPTTTDDVSLIHAELALQTAASAAQRNDNLTVEEATELVTKNNMEVYGHISLSAVSGYPLLIVGTNVRTYIHFSQIEALLNEVELQSPCTFSIVTAYKEFKFYTSTSADYQRWIGALTEAFTNLNFNLKHESYRPVSPESFNEALHHHGTAVSPVFQTGQFESERRQSVTSPSHLDMPARSIVDADPIAWDSRLSRNAEIIIGADTTDDNVLSTKSSRLFSKIKSFFKHDQALHNNQDHGQDIRATPRNRSQSRSRTVLGHRRRFSFVTEDNLSEDTRIGRKSNVSSYSRSDARSRSNSRSRSITQFFTGLVPSLRLGDSGQSFSKMVSEGVSHQPENQYYGSSQPNPSYR